MRPRKLWTQILASQLAVVLIAVMCGFGLFLRDLRQDLDRQYEQKALLIARASANGRLMRSAMASGDPQHQVAVLAERMRTATGASYIVVLDRNGVQHSHPDPARIGQRVRGSVIALDGTEHVDVNDGTPGRSASGAVPLRGPDGRVVGQVSAGIAENRVSSAVWHSLPALLLCVLGALGVGAAASLLMAGRLKRRTFGLDLAAIADLLQEREAMLHGVGEGVITVDPMGNVSLVNDEARRLLGLRTDGGPQGVRDLAPPGRLRDVLTGAAGERIDETVLTGQHILMVGRMPVSHDGRFLGVVITLRDRTEVVGLLRELDSARSFTDALRVQHHEHANRLHAVAGLLGLGRVEEANDYLSRLSVASPALAEELREHIGNEAVAGLLLAKATVAAERGVRLTFAGDGKNTRPTDGIDLVVVTVLGNLVDNAIDAAADGERPAVHVVFSHLDSGEVAIEVSDNGPGIDGDVDALFRDGYSTKPPRNGMHRGLGLALVDRLVARAGGTITVEDGPGAVFRITLPSGLRRPVATGPASAPSHSTTPSHPITQSHSTRLP
ncbi:MAG: dcuS 4 [Frankiales bacterium]|nr:dcuS 4 [Frankiales bacterium]